jgi:hypothetical protein
MNMENFEWAMVGAMGKNSIAKVSVKVIAPKVEVQMRHSRIDGTGFVS